ncbi:hypothetical protein [uncultured Rikenella sp.]|uniref:hypothetical protein n=1 Tax=uncultured Rikenella sp. TaxID=368003 RepID=UPI00272B4548|nr:hypothetical protein [uncultured Rikenella sp.]
MISLFVFEGTVLFNFAALVFLLAARQFANFVCIALAGSVGCEQKEPKKLQSASLRDALAVSARMVGLDFRRARLGDMPYI